MLRWIGLIVGALVLGYVGILAWIYLSQRSMQYFPSHRDADGRGNDGFKPWKDAQGKFLGYVREATRPVRVILFFHGNGGEAIDRDWLSEIVPPNAVLLLAEYPGYGARAGKTTQAAVLQSAEEQVAEIRRAWGEIPLTVVGESLGTGVACFVASKYAVDRLALISPFSSLADAAAFHFPYLPVRLLLKDDYPSETYLRTAKAPLRIVHGTQDNIVPLALGKRLFASYTGGEKKFSEIPGVGHNDMAIAILHSPFADDFREFLEK